MVIKNVNLFVGQVFNQERRLVFCGYTVGDLVVRPRTTIWQHDRWTSDRKLWSLLPQWQFGNIPAAAWVLSAGDLWLDAGVLEQGGRAETNLQGDSHVSSTEEHGVWPGTGHGPQRHRIRRLWVCHIFLLIAPNLTASIKNSIANPSQHGLCCVCSNNCKIHWSVI